jgi:hypothetical protein
VRVYLDEASNHMQVSDTLLDKTSGNEKKLGNLSTVSLKTLTELNQKATATLTRIADHEQNGYSAGEIAAAKRLLGKEAKG